AARRGGAAQLIGGRIDPAVGEGRGQRITSLEEERQDGDSLRNLELAVVVRVVRVGAAASLAPREEEVEEVDRVGDLEAPVAVGVAADEGGRRGSNHAERQDRQDENAGAA